MKVTVRVVEYPAKQGPGWFARSTLGELCYVGPAALPQTQPVRMAHPDEGDWLELNVENHLDFAKPTVFAGVAVDMVIYYVTAFRKLSPVEVLALPHYALAAGRSR